MEIQPKKIFDDAYLYLQEIDRTHVKDAVKGIDPRNGMVTKGYEEISAAYWNLIYKDAT